MRKGTKRPKFPTLYVAVVVTDPFNPEDARACLSDRADGSWACFVATSKDVAVRRAVAAAERWGTGSVVERDEGDRQREEE